MKKIAVTIEGISELMMHNPESMGQTMSGKKSIPEPAVEAAASRYLMPDGKTLCLYSDHIHRCLMLASKGFRLAARQPLMPYISGSIEILPERISLGTVKYVVDVRRVVIQGKGVRRARAKVWPWKATFELHYDEEVFRQDFMDKVIRDQVFLTAGRAIGLLEYRPAKGGKFGRFRVIKWEH